MQATRLYVGQHDLVAVALTSSRQAATSVPSALVHLAPGTGGGRLGRGPTPNTLSSTVHDRLLTLFMIRIPSDGAPFHRGINSVFAFPVQLNRQACPSPGSGACKWGPWLAVLAVLPGIRGPLSHCRFTAAGPRANVLLSTANWSGTTTQVKDATPATDTTAASGKA